MILDCIIWPSSITIIFESYKELDDDDESAITDVHRVSGYLKTFVGNGMFFVLWTVCFTVSYCSMKSVQQIVVCLTSCHFNTASPVELKRLVKFWIGWELPATEMKVEVVEASLPTASTCFEKLRLPRHYATYKIFHQDLCACISTSYSGFGCPWGGIMLFTCECRLNVWHLLVCLWRVWCVWCVWCVCVLQFA